MYDNEKRLIELFLKNSEEAVSVIEVEIQEEIKGCDSTKKKIRNIGNNLRKDGRRSESD